MRGSKYFIVLVTSLIFALGLVAAINPAKTLGSPKVKVYVDQPLGYIPFVAPGGTVEFDIIIETSGITDDSPGGIVQLAMDIRVNPASLNIYRGRLLGATSGYFLWEFADWYWYDYPTLFTGTIDHLTGYWDEASEAIIPTPEFGGAGDDFSGLKLVTIRIRSASDTIPCVIHLLNVEYRSQDGAWHPVDVVMDGYYGPPPPHAEFTYTPSMPLVDDTVTFNASASYDPDGYIESYEWDFGDETTGTGMVVTHNYTEAGTYTVTLNVTDNDALWDIESQNVTVYGPPVASFTYSPSEPSLGETVTFNASASYDPDGGNETYPSGIVSYEWDFGDGTTRRNPVPSWAVVHPRCSANSSASASE